MVASEAPSTVQAEVASEYVAKSGETWKQDDPDFLLQTPVVWDLECTDYPAGNPEYVQTTPAGHILSGF